MSNWTADQIPNQAGKLAVVTGANSGTGYYTALELARAGAKVIIACRNEGKGKSALGRMLTEVPDGQIELAVLDLSSLASVRKFADNFLSRNQALDLLVNNAGIMAIPKRIETADGFEMQLATNHLGHFALTGLLLPALKSKPSSRVVTVSSNAHRRGQIHFDDLQLEHGYSAWRAYSQSKLANLLFAFELQRKSDQAGWQIISLAAHPGWSTTGIHDSGPAMGGGSFGAFLVKNLSGLLGMPAAQGALPLLYAGTAPDVTPGGYYGPNGFSEISGYPGKAKPTAQAQGKAFAEKLWEMSEQLTGVSFKAATGTKV